MLRNLFLYFVLILAALAANNYALYTNLKQLDGHQELVRQTNEVIRNTDRIMVAIRSAEAMGRGYMLAPTEQSFITRYDEHIAEVWTFFGELEKSAAGHLDQREALVELRRLIDERVKRMNENLRVARQRPDFSYTEMVMIGKETMDRLSRHLRGIRETERKVLGVRAGQAASSRQLVFWTFLISMFVNLSLVVASYVLLRRHLAAQIVAQEQQAHRAWVQDKLIGVGKIFGAQLNPKHVAEETLKFFTAQLNFTAANFFVMQDNQLSREASLAGPLKLRGQSQIAVNEGLVGAALKRRDIQQITDIPEGYFTIESGLGTAAPKVLTLVPLYFQEASLGVIELASFEELAPRQLDLLPQLQERIATILSASIAHEKQLDLLEETQRQAEELQAQQEELRTNNEELEEQASALLRAQERQQSQQEELRQINEELEAQARSLEHQQEALSLRNAEVESARRESEMRAVELERTNKYKSEFLAKMSHELRTPLNSMLILSALLGEDKDRNLTKQQLEFARTIHDAGADLLNLINDILDLSKLEAGKLVLQPEPFSLKAHLEQLEAQFRPIMESKNIKFKIDVGPGVPDILRTDRQRLEQVLRNLLSNAAKFTEDGDVKLDVQLAANDKSRVRFAVHDTGIGIPKEKKQQIFEAFEQVDGTISRRFGGTGLGLTISRELAALLKGVLELESQENVGSTFILEIPADVGSPAKTEPAVAAQAAANTIQPRRREEPPSAPAVPAAPKDISRLIKQVKDSTHGRSLLIVEDDSGFTKALADSARTHGFDPVVAGDGETALEFLKHHVPSAILLDIKLPGISGMSVLENIKQNPKLRHIPAHMISGLDNQVPALRLGAIGYLSKPVSLEGVKGAFEKIEHMLDKRVKQVLVIEDDERQVKAMFELLSGPGVEISTAKTAREALGHIEKQEFECVIVDLTLPDVSGIELLEKLHEALGEKVPPIIVYTGRDLGRDEEEKLREFSESIIIKGAKSPERLLDEVNLFLHRVESDLPEDQRSMLSEMRMKERGFEGRSVLLVDDDLRNIFALTSALESKGLKVFAARNGYEALEGLEKHPEVDAVLMDIMMPKMDGFEAMKRIRENRKFKDLPIIALTAKAMKGDYERCLAAGANDYLPKPVNLMNLISVLKVWLTGKRVWL